MDNNLRAFVPAHKIPAHKVRGDDHKPGQIVNPLGFVVSGRKEDTTLGDYIARKQRSDAFDQVNNERKLTFDDWWRLQGFYIDLDHMKHEMELCWKAAQENV